MTAINEGLVVLSGKIRDTPAWGRAGVVRANTPISQSGLWIVDLLLVDDHVYINMCIFACVYE